MEELKVLRSSWELALQERYRYYLKKRTEIEIKEQRFVLYSRRDVELRKQSVNTLLTALEMDTGDAAQHQLSGCMQRIRAQFATVCVCAYNTTETQLKCVTVLYVVGNEKSYGLEK